MIFITAIPDAFYFTWQLELQLYNLSILGIPKEYIHILIGYDPKSGLNDPYIHLIHQFRYMACFYTYIDRRIKKKYPPSIRPYLLSVHFNNFPSLSKEIIFYCDTDVIFREWPNFEKIKDNNTWYVSDTRSYLDSNYIIRCGGEGLLNKMCEKVGIEVSTVVKGDIHCGGAQYLMKSVPLSFWEKVLCDCEELCEIMDCYNLEVAKNEFIKTGKKRSDCYGIQSWCADMWAILWNAFYFNFEVRIHDELSFCWSTDPINEWGRKKILHYSGKIDKEDRSVFRKANYINYSPFYDPSIQKVSPKNCSFQVVKLIEKYRLILNKSRTDMPDLTFLIPVRIDSESRLSNLYYNVWYLDKYFKTNIIIAESDLEKRIDESLLPASCEYHYLNDTNPFLHHTKINNWLIRKSKTNFIAIYDTDVIIPAHQILDSIALLRNTDCSMVYPYDGTFLMVDSLFKEIFGKLLDFQVLSLNQNKFVVSFKRSVGGAVCLNRRKYIQAGGDNESFESWGPEDLERSKRMRNLGHVVRRVNGNLYHLQHERLRNSSYQTPEIRVIYMEEYIKISNMKKSELENYIASWPWHFNIS